MRLALILLSLAGCTNPRPECGRANHGAKSVGTYLSGVVYVDQNHNGLRDSGETGFAGVLVSNGRDVVRTDSEGQYRLPVLDEMVVFITQPAGYAASRFFRIHRPHGSPSAIQEYSGIDPTGKLPETVDFAITPTERSDRFRMIALGDTQVHTDEHVSFLRDSLLPAVARLEVRPTFAIAMGDLVNNTLSLYPRYLEIMDSLEFKTHYVPGNHDMNFDAPNDRYALETYQRVFGPSYYSFEYGAVHFVVLDSVVLDAHGHEDYHGELDATQLEWLEQDLAQVSSDRLIVLNMHIPFASWIDRQQHDGRADICNRKAVFDLVAGRKVLALAGHTHTVENSAANHSEQGWGQPIPFPQIITGAVCGSWWEGKSAPSGIPLSYMRDGSPRGFFVFDFDGTDYRYRYVPTVGNEAAMRLSVTDENGGPLPNGIAREGALLLANIWSARTDATVIFEISGVTVRGFRNTSLPDPVAVAHLEDLSSRLMMKNTSHMWTATTPSLLPGIHRWAVTVRNPDGTTFSAAKVIEYR